MSRFPGNIIKLPNVTPTQNSASGVWSLKDQMVYQRNNLWPFQRDPYFNYTTLLLQGNVPNTTGPQAMTLPLSYNADASTNNFIVTPNGDVGPKPFSPYFGGNYSVYFDGTSGQYLNTPSNAAFAMGLVAFTLEAWVYVTGTNYCEIFTTAFGSFPTTAYRLMVTNTQKLQYYDGTNSATSTTSIPLNTWTHVCVVREGTGSNQTKLYINGSQDGSTTSSNNLTNSTGYIGRTWDGIIFTGYISNLRLVKGTAVYTTNFTPSTQPLQNITNTSLLTCQSNRFIDNSTANSGSGFTLTANGSPRITDNSPFVSTDFTTGAGYFTGATTDYFRIADNAALDMGSGSFTIECFYYPAVSITTAQGSAVFGKRATGGTYGGVTGEFYETYAPKFISTVNGSSWGVNIISSILCVQNQWNHIAWVRNGDAWTIYVNGQAGGSVNLPGTIPDNTADFTIGATDSSASSYKLRQGYLSDFRVVKGVAVYTGNFTPPSLGMLKTSGATSIAAYPSTTNVNTSFAESATSLLTLQTRAPSQNIGFIDSSPNEFIVTKNGNTTQGTFTPFSPTGWGNYFGGANTLSTPQTTATDLGSGAFTVEAWIYPLNFTGNQRIIAKQRSSDGYGWIFRLNATTGYLFLEVDTGAVVTSTSAPALNTWSHVAAVRNGNSVTVYLNGSAVGTNNSYSGSPTSVSATLTIGSSSGGEYFSGYISNLRLIRGQALATGAFTPPAGPVSNSVVGWTGSNVPTQSITGTFGVLTCQSNRFVDNSPNNLALTPSSTLSVQAFSPFAPANAVSPLVTGGSGYFDGTGDYLSAANNAAFAFGTGNFTVEFWVWANSSSTTHGLVASDQTGTYWASLIFSGTIYWQSVNGSTNLLSTSYANYYNQWTHVAYVRNSNVTKMYLNGVEKASAADSTNYTGTSGNIDIGRDLDNSAYLTGYMSDVRVVKGTAVYTSNFTPPTGPPTAIPNTSLLLNFTNGAAVDATGKNNLESVGKAQNSGVQAKWDPLRGGSSMYFDGTTDRLILPKASWRPFGSGAFTIECWFRVSAISGVRTIISQDWLRGISGPTFSLFIGEPTSDRLTYFANGGAISIIAGSGSAIVADTWYHLAVVKSASTTTMYLNALVIGTPAADTYTYPTGTNNIYIGASDTGGSLSADLNGYVQNLRITVGIARYSGTSTSVANFTLPTGPFPIG